MQRIDRFLDFLLFERGEAVTIDSASTIAIISDAPKGVDYYFDDKYMRTKTPFKTGSVVEYRGEAWLVVSQIAKHNPSVQARLRKCNHSTKFIVDSWLYEFPSFIEMLNLSINQGGTLNLAAGKLECTLQANAITGQLQMNQRFIVSDTPWKIAGVDKTKTGLVILNTERDLIASGDDMENEIANADTLPAWRIGLTDDNREISIDEPYPFTAVLYRDTSEEQGAVFLWDSSDETVATVDDGVVSGVALGSATITVRWAKHPSILFRFDVEIVDSTPEVVTYRFYQSELDSSGKNYTDFDILQGTTMKYGIEKYINGVLAPQNDTYAYTLTQNGVPAANYVYTVIDGYAIKLENKKMYLNAPLRLAGKSNASGETMLIEIYLMGAW